MPVSDPRDFRPPPVAPNGSDRVDRDEKGRFQRGNESAVTTGLRAQRLPEQFAHLRAEVQAFVDATLIDEGDPDSAPARRRALLEYRGRLDRRIRQLDDALELRGLLDRKGKLRTAWLQQLAGLIEKARSLDVTLGLERRQKRVPDLDAYVAQRYSSTPEAESKP